MAHFRKVLETTIGAAKLPGSGRSSPNPMKPSVVDFRADVVKALAARIPKDVSVNKFFDAYVYYDSEDAIEREQHAQKILGDRRHSVEQRVGAEFVLRGIHPCTAYFTSVRGTVTYAKEKDKVG